MGNIIRTEKADRLTPSLAMLFRADNGMSQFLIDNPACPNCDGHGWIHTKNVGRKPHCWSCDGTGWADIVFGRAFA